MLIKFLSSVGLIISVLSYYSGGNSIRYSPYSPHIVFGKDRHLSGLVWHLLPRYSAENLLSSEFKARASTDAKCIIRMAL